VVKIEWEIKGFVKKIEEILLGKYDVRLYCEKNGVCKYAGGFNIPLFGESYEAEPINEDEILVFNINSNQ